jgi:hypothetical protein
MMPQVIRLLTISFRLMVYVYHWDKEDGRENLTGERREGLVIEGSCSLFGHER